VRVADERVVLLVSVDLLLSDQPEADLVGEEPHLDVVLIAVVEEDEGAEEQPKGGQGDADDDDGYGEVAQVF